MGRGKDGTSMNGIEDGVRWGETGLEQGWHTSRASRGIGARPEGGLSRRDSFGYH